MNNQPTEKEFIDAFEILKRINQYISNTTKNIKATIKNNFLKLFLIVIVFSSIGYLAFYISPKVFEAEMIVAHKRLTNDECGEIFEQLKKIEATPEILSKELNMSFSDCEKIKTIRFQPLNSKYSKIYADSTKDSSPFKVIIETYDYSVYDSLQKKIIIYLEKNEYSVARKNADLNYLENYEQRINKVLIDLDSLKRITNLNLMKIKSNDNGLTIDAIDPVKISEAELKFYESKLKLIQLKDLNNSFEILKGFVSTNKPSNLSWVFYISLSGLIGFLLSIIMFYKKSN
jgi:hypothetical protein